MGGMNGEKTLERLDLWASETDAEANEAWGHLGYRVMEIVTPEGDPVAGGKKAIIHNGDVVGIVGKSYRLIPNEVFKEYVVEAADALGAESFRVYETTTQYVGTFYIPGKIGGPGGELQLGFTAANSIDGSMAAKFMGFTFRGVCKNGVIMGYKSGTSLFRMHTLSAYEDFLLNGREMVMMGIQEAIALTEAEVHRLAEIAVQKIRTPIGMKILRNLRESRLPRFARPEYLIPTDEEKYPEPPRGARIWDVYNDVTARLTHDISDTVRPVSVIDYHNTLHRAIVLAIEE